MQGLAQNTYHLIAILNVEVIPNKYKFNKPSHMSVKRN